MTDTSRSSGQKQTASVAPATLRDLLRRQVDAARDEALRSDGRISSESIAEVEQLARLAEISATVHPAPKSRWPLVASLAVTLLIVSLLLFARVRETEIVLDLALSEASFESPRPQLFTDALRLTALGAIGLREIEMPRASGRAERTLRAVDGERPALQLSTNFDGPRDGSVTLEPLALPPGTQVALRSSAAPNQFRLSLSGAAIVVRVSVSGRVRVGISGTPGEDIDFPAPASVLLRSDANQIDLDLSFAQAAPLAFVSQLAARDLSLSEIEQYLSPDRTLVRRVSTILSGSLYFESLGGRERKLRAGESIQLVAAQGEIRTLRLGDQQIALGFHGSVRDIIGGAGESSRSLMPTYLEWLQARHGLSLLWGTTLYVFGLLLGVLRWWGYKL